MTTRFGTRAHADGDVLRTPGVDYGRPLKIIYRNGNRLVVRRAGCKQWCSVGQSEYTPTLYILLELRGNMMFELKQITPGHNWRPALKQLLAECDSLIACSDCDGTGAACGGHWKCGTCGATGYVKRESV